jgi:hypothetical protein
MGLFLALGPHHRRGHPGSMPIAAARSSARRHASEPVAPSARIRFSPFVPITTQT